MERRVTPGSKVYRGVLPVVRDRHCELQVAELEQLEVLSTDAAKRYLKRIKWYLADAHRLWFQSCLHTFDQNQTVVIIDTSDSAKSWMHEAVTVLRSLSNHTSGKLNFIQFNDGIKVWQQQCYAMNAHARDDLNLWLQCIRTYGGSSMLTEAIRKSFLYKPKQIVVLTDGIFEISPELLYQELISANGKQIPIHFVMPTQEYKEPQMHIVGYKSVKQQLNTVLMIIKKLCKMFGGSFCIPPSPSAIDLALGHIGHAQYQKQDDKFSPSVFKI